MAYKIWLFLWYFVLASFCGWVAEVGYIGMVYRKFKNPGMLNGPYCPQYGPDDCAAVGGIDGAALADVVCCHAVFLPDFKLSCGIHVRVAAAQNNAHPPA